MYYCLAFFLEKHDRLHFRLLVNFPVRGSSESKLKQLRTLLPTLLINNMESSPHKDFVRNQISTVRGEISALETRLVRWIVATGLVVVGLLITVVTVF